MHGRSGNNPKRRIIPLTQLDADAREQLAARVRYVGSGHHKRSPADYGMDRTSPRPTKSLCDAAKLVTLDEARRLLREGILSLGPWLARLVTIAFRSTYGAWRTTGKSMRQRRTRTRQGNITGILLRPKMTCVRT